MTLPERPPLDRSRLSAVPGWTITVVETSESTNTDLLAVASTSPSGAVLVAEHQTAGLGRLGRQWESPARSSVTVSVLLRPTVERSVWAWLPLLAGVALCDVVCGLGVPAGLKWPNDLITGPDELKSAGILAQVAGDAVVIGIGVNVTNTPEELPIPTATSLSHSGATNLDRTHLLLALLRAIGSRYTSWTEAGGDAERSGLADAYRAHCVTIGRAVTVSAIEGHVDEGTVTGIDAHGRLMLRTADSRCITIAAGDVAHLRPLPR